MIIKLYFKCMLAQVCVSKSIVVHLQNFQITWTTKGVVL